jgi:hypothetical protein
LLNLSKASVILVDKEKPKTASSETTPNKAQAIAVKPAPPERLNFKMLLLQNPNHFGTFPNLPGKVVLPKKFDTAFEEVTCLGLNPEQNKLEAVVQIKQHNGYITDACGVGSREYVRFFVQHGTVWHDLGDTFFDAFDLAGPLPLSYCVSVDFKEAHKFCTAENILNVRAILSWNLEPTPGDPNFLPPWGNVLDVRVQVAPLLIAKVPLKTLVSEGLVKVDTAAIGSIDFEKTLPSKVEPAQPYSVLKQLYAKTDVPSHRFGFAAAQKIVQHPVLSIPPGSVAKSGGIASVSELAAGPELSAILGALAKLSGDVSFEEMKCAGYNPQTRELEAVIEIKRNAGYSGGLCTQGSTEYVSFFAFFGGAWQPLGTATVRVHDLAAITPGHSLMYAVHRISNMTEMPCKSLAGVPLRAILSWEQQPTGPNFNPTWGNVINTHVQPIIGEVTGEHMRLMRIGGVTINRISDITHLAYPRGLGDPAHGLPVIAGDCSGDDSPFGGELIVEGDFTPKPDVFNHVTGVVVPGGKPIIYQVWVTRTDIPSVPFQLTNAFNIGVFPPNALFPPVTLSQHLQLPPGPVLGGVPGDQYYQYMESDLQAVNPRALAAFEAGGLAEGDYRIEVRPWVWTGVHYQSVASQFKTVHVFNGYKHTEIIGGSPTTVFRPEVHLTLTSIPDCADAKIGDTVNGSYSVVDHFFNAVSIALVPITISGVPVVEPSVTVTPDPGAAASYDGTNTGGSHGTFSLNTATLPACGYTIQLVASDRTIVDSHCDRHWNLIGVGFCLRKP